jgi:flagellar basal body-associated protein FliL
MADQNEPEQNPQNAKKSVLGTLVWTVIAALSVAGGLATPYVASQVAGKTSDTKASQLDPNAPPPMPGATGEVAYIDFGESLVNLDDARLNRYLRVKITLQVDKNQETAISELIESRKIVLKNWLLGYLSDRDMQDIRGAAGQNRLRREIHSYFNATLFPDGYDRIHDVLFEEFNVQ